MKITQAEWNKYIKTMSLLSDTASKEFAEWANNNGGWNAIDRNLMAEAAYQIASKYADSSSALAGEMYEAIANAENKIVKRAEMADEVDYGQLAKAINGALKHSTNDNFVSSPVGRAVKQAGADTMLKNASRDGAEFAWIPSGDSCPFCLVLASNGWRRASKKTTNGNHAEHIHTNCNCQFAIRFNKDTQIEGYDPSIYEKMYYDAEGNTWKEKIKTLQTNYRNSFKKLSNDGKIIIDGDVFVPCLQKVSTGDLVDTIVEKVDRKELKGYTKENGWYVNWSKMPKEANIYKLTVKGDDEIQGLIGMTPNYEAQSMYLNWIVTAPQNNKLLLNGKPKKYEGVGGHLMAIAAEKSIENGFDGYAYGYAANTELIQQYHDRFGAEWVPIGHPYQVVFSGPNMKKLLELYNYEWKE